MQTGIDVTPIVTNAALLTVVVFFVRRWMIGIEAKLDTAINRFDKCQTEERCREFRAAYVSELKEQNKKYSDEVSLVRERTHTLANEVQKRVEWEYCRDCPKRPKE